METTNLKFVGDWSLLAGLPLATVIAALAWWLYWRESRHRTDALRWMLPTLRALAILWLLLVLTGPVLHHRKVIGEVARILLFVDGSASMSASDEQMDPGRKLLIAQQLGWLHGEKVDSALRQASVAMASASAHADSVRMEMRPEELVELAQNFAQEVATATEQLGKVRPESWPGGSVPLDQLRRDLVEPSKELAQYARDEPKPKPERIIREIATLARAAAGWDRDISDAVSAQVQQFVKSGDSTVANAMAKFDASTRWDRMEGLLLEGRANMLGELASHHRVELSALNDIKSDVIWVPRPGEAIGDINLPESFRLTPTNQATDLADGIEARLQDVKDGDRAAVVVFSDGQHNSGKSPQQLAKLLGTRKVPVFTVAVGSPNHPADLAVLDVDAPDTVFHEASVKGDIILKDDVPVGRPFTLSIKHDGVTVWDRSLTTEANPRRSIPFDFPVKQLVEKVRRTKDRDLKFGMLPMSFTVEATAVEGERNTTNNVSRLLFSAITEKPKVLLLEGRPRWEFRYLRNLLERDQRWDINVLLAGAGGEERPWVRGKQSGQFPPDLETLFGYQLIVFGDVPLNMMRATELEWIKDFVEKRGGGVVFIDGREVQLVNYSQTPIGTLLPVSWSRAPLTGSGIQFKMVASGNSRVPLSLASEDAQNAEIWAGLPTPRWVAPAKALPGAEPLLEASSRELKADALVFRRYGAGRVLYAGFDESWRWRYDVGDLHHQKFWNQIAKWIMEPPYPVEDKFAALDSGPSNYAPGDSADIRARLKDSQGRLLLKAKADAVLYRNGQKAAAVTLESDQNTGGTFRGHTPPLDPGDYEVRLQVDGIPSGDIKVMTEFHVAPMGTPEMAQLHANEQLLREMAFHSGGEFYREEEATRLLKKLEPLSEGRILETETVLWQSWWWFTPMILLVTLEWALRKRAGMI